jgi:tryptophan-rich sensory protein
MLRTAMSFALLLAIMVCAATAALEGICAGTKVTEFFSSNRFPRYSAPLWAWSIIGAAYYLIFGFVFYRVLGIDQSIDLRSVAVALIIFMMVANALSNYVIFRMKDLRLGFVIGSIFPLLDLALFACLLQLDSTASVALAPYLIYRVYAVYWGYALWKANLRPNGSAVNG